MIRDGKTSTEIHRQVKSERITGTANSEDSLEEFTLVDGAGRVQIPKDFLEILKINTLAKVHVEDGKITLTPGESNYE